MQKDKCKSCGYEGINRFLELGNIPPVNAFLAPEDIQSEEAHPLNLAYCPNCFLVQLEKIVPPEKLFRNYFHLSAASQSNIEHLKEVARALSNKFNVSKDTKVLEIGSNDGTLLSFFKEHTSNLLGVDPAQNLAEINKQKGISYIPEFFDTSIASKIAKDKGKFDLIVALNVIPHTPDNIDLLKAARIVMKDSGVLVMEGVYALETILNGQFDTIYHEHVYTFSLHSLIKTFHMAGLTIVDVDKISTQGGSLRVFARKSEHVNFISDSVRNILKEEEVLGLTNPEIYNAVAKKVEIFKSKLKALINSEKIIHGKLIGLGAPARGVVILNYCNIGVDDIEYLADDTILKQNKVAPGVHIPVKSWDAVIKDKKTGYFLLSWNYKEFFIKRLKEIVPSFSILVPFPELEVKRIG